MELQYLMTCIAEWSDNTFGNNRRPINTINHLKKEVNELLEAPYDTEEYADCFMLLLDSFRMAGGNAKQLLENTWLKLEKNKNRKWGKPDENGVVEHLRD